MRDNATFLEIEYPCDQAVDWIIQRLRQAGLLVMRTFDLQSARQAQPSCFCPYHGTDPCDCQWMVLLVYQPNQTPVAITAHGYDQQTWFSFVDTALQRADPRLESIILSLTAPQILDISHSENDT